jgi:radical SAM superfamily enzyme YgiQ (UPF0313 family)
MAEIVLSTLNAKYIHTGFGLRYLMANLGGLKSRARLIEFDLQQRAVDVAETLLAEHPKIVGLGVYIWNATQMAELAPVLKRAAPDVFLVLGGPEISHETERQALAQWADCIIAGEADIEFSKLCNRVLEGKPPGERILRPVAPDLETLAMPYDLYDDEAIANRVVYVETSRGCPFSCEFCLSSLETAVRRFPLEAFLVEMDKLIARGARQFKFVDRTFNIHLPSAKAVLEFFLERFKPGMFLHFEMVPDRIPPELRDTLARFPAGSIQLEIGVQTFNPEVAARIGRRQDYQALEENFHYLRGSTRAHLHADLIFGLPGETLDSVGAGFDRLLALGPQEIQVGILKRLRGAPISRHDQEWDMAYNPCPPYEILRNSAIGFFDMQRLRRFARYWDLTVNSGKFLESAPLIWEGAASAFAEFMAWSDWLFAQVGRQHGIALGRLAELLFIYVTTIRGRSAQESADKMWRDWQRAGQRERPEFLADYISNEEVSRVRKLAHASKRQDRHLG